MTGWRDALRGSREHDGAGHETPDRLTMEAIDRIRSYGRAVSPDPVFEQRLRRDLLRSHQQRAARISQLRRLPTVPALVGWVPAAVLTLLVLELLLGGGRPAAPRPAVGTQGPTSVAQWAAAWPMAGHDPQRTARIPGLGPHHPHLMWTYTGAFGPPLIGPDGTIYSLSNDGVIALGPTGRRLWVVASRDAEGGPPALGPDGILRVSAQLPDNAGVFTSPSQPHIAFVGIAGSGQVLWTVRSLPWATVPQSVPFSKGVAPLVSASSALYVPLVGPVYRAGQNNGVEMVSRAGKALHRLLPGFSGPIALAPDGTLYELGWDGQGHSTLLASSGTGTALWSRPVIFDQQGAVLVGTHGTVYVAADTIGAMSGEGDVGEVAAYTPDGTLLWQVRSAGVASLAERADGTLIVLDQHELSAFTPRGVRLWRRILPRRATASISSPPLAVDAAGWVYAGTGTGAVAVIDPSGTVQARLTGARAAPTTGPLAFALGPTGSLVVTGADGVLRLYR